MEQKTYVEDINRSIYDFKNEESDENTVRFDEGLTPGIVEKISEEKGDPEWMREFHDNSPK